MRQGPPPTIGPYEIRGELGRGGMGVVYRAHRPDLKKDYALKVILPGQDAAVDAVARFRREAQAAAQLGSHTGIVACHDIGEHDGKVYFAMDLVEGTSLEHLIDEGDLSKEQSARIVEGAARALHFAHANGILHRDIKPGNLLVTADGQTKVADFGLAGLQDTDQQSAKLTKSGMVLGTAAYMPPEQARGETLDARADVYALGATLYECLVSSPPFGGGSVYEVLAKLMSEAPKPPRKRDPRVPRDLDTITLKCLEKDPDRRYPTAEALATDLSRWRSGEPIAARPAGRLERFTKHVRRHRLPWAVGGVLGAVVLILAGALGFGAWAERLEFAADLRAADLMANDAPEQALGRLEKLAERAGPDYPGLAEIRQRAAARADGRRLEALTNQALQLLEMGLDHCAIHEQALARVKRLESELEVARREGTATDAEIDALAALALELRRAEAQLGEAYATAQSWLLGAFNLLEGRPLQLPYRKSLEALAGLARARLAHADRSGGGDAPRFLTDLRRYSDLLAEIGDTSHATFVRGDGALTLDTSPSGATVECRRFRAAADGRQEAVPFDPASGTYREQAVTLGTTPLRADPMPMGSYLLVIRSPGMRDTPYPVLIERSEHDVVPKPIPLHSGDRIGEGFLYIPPGDTVLGGDEEAFNSWRRRTSWVGGDQGYCLSEGEVTMGEYRAFLLDQLRSRVLTVGEVRQMIPRFIPGGKGPWRVTATEIRADATLADRPVVNISWHDAIAYCRWRSRRDDRPYTLPTEAEWVRAARGADGRRFIWGDTFRWAWACAGRSPIHTDDSTYPRAILAVAADVSVFGVRDLGGNVREWCLDEPPDFPTLRALRGGMSSDRSVHQLRVGSRHVLAPARARSRIGFRLRTIPKAE